MWWTSEGERVLRGAEWELFREGVSGIWDHIEASSEEDSFCCGIKAFDHLQTNQKLALLALVAKALRDETVSMPELRHTPKEQSPQFSSTFVNRSRLKSAFIRSRESRQMPPSGGSLSWPLAGRSRKIGKSRYQSLLVMSRMNGVS